MQLDRLKLLLQERGMTQKQLSEKLKISKNIFANWREQTPRQSTLNAVAYFFDVSPEWLTGESDVRNLYAPAETDGVSFPVIGEAAAGYDHIAQENWTGETADIPRKYLAGRPARDYFVLKIVGDSMYPFFLEGDRVLILKDSSVPESGTVCLFRYNGENATLKRLEYTDYTQQVKLSPINPMIPATILTGSELTGCGVIGIPKLILRPL